MEQQQARPVAADMAAAEGVPSCAGETIRPAEAGFPVRGLGWGGWE